MCQVCGASPVDRGGLRRHDGEDPQLQHAGEDQGPRGPLGLHPPRGCAPVAAASAVVVGRHDDQALGLGEGLEVRGHLRGSLALRHDGPVEPQGPLLLRLGVPRPDYQNLGCVGRHRRPLHLDGPPARRELHRLRQSGREALLGLRF